jgi:hypothetical protein
VGITPPGGHGDRNTMTVAVPIAGGSTVTVFDNCYVGFGSIRIGIPLLSWSGDERAVFVSLRYFGFGSAKTLAIPSSPETPPPAFPNRVSSEDQLEKIPGAHLINDDNIYPTQSPTRYVTPRHSTKANCFASTFRNNHR